MRMERVETRRSANANEGMEGEKEGSYYRETCWVITGIMQDSGSWGFYNWLLTRAPYMHSFYGTWQGKTARGGISWSNSAQFCGHQLGVTRKYPTAAAKSAWSLVLREVLVHRKREPHTPYSILHTQEPGAPKWWHCTTPYSFPWSSHKKDYEQNSIIFFLALEY